MDNYDELDKEYLNMIQPKKLIEGMDYDDFVDWAERGTKKDIECAIRVFKMWDLHEHVKIMEVIIKRETYRKV